jgi:eukaryotic-like serine/threonine-protein kinase
MGEVFEAVHVGLNKPVVVKLLHQAMAKDPRFADRLRVEAQTLASLESPFLVSVSDIGCTPDKRPFFAMELLHGATLRQVLDRRGPLTPSIAISLMIQVLTGLSAAHRLGIIHRDVKLDNLFLCQRTPDRGPIVKVLDFGIAKVLQSAGLPFPGPQYATEEGNLVGTPRYVSPEQIRFEPVDARTDVYSVGIVLYMLLVGQGPFPGARNMLALLNAHLLEVPRPPSQAAAQHIPPELDRAVLKALAKQPALRFQSAELFADELQRISARLAEQTQPLSTAGPELSSTVDPEADDTSVTPFLAPNLAREQATEHESSRVRSTGRGTWIMPAPVESSPAAPEHAAAGIEESWFGSGDGAQPLAALPVNLAEPSALDGMAPAVLAPSVQSAPLDRRVFVAIALASAVLFSSVFVSVLRILGLM